MRIRAKDGWFRQVLQVVRDALPELNEHDTVGIAEGNIELDEGRVERILAKMADPDELCEFVG
jgi:hypothetical protein